MTLCSKCSATVRPVVAIDIDGTLADYHMHFTRFVGRYFNTPWYRGEGDFCPQWDGSGELEDWMGITKAQYREAKLAFRQGGNKRWAPAYRGASEFVRGIREVAEVWLVTQRPWLSLDNINPDTRHWLDCQGIQYDGLLFDEDKYTRLTEQVDPQRITAVIEDLPEMIDAARALQLVPFQVERPHNQAEQCHRYPRGTLTLASEWTRLRIENWEKEMSNA